MSRIVPVLAAVAALSAATPAQAVITSTYYAVTGSNASGNFSLDYDSVTSNYTLTGLNILIGAHFDASDVVVYPRLPSPDLAIDGLPGVGIVIPGLDGFYLQIDPTAASQTTPLNITLDDLNGSGISTATVEQTGTSGSITEYSVGGPYAAGTFSLQFNNVTSSYSLSALDITIGTSFDGSDTVLRTSGSNLVLDGLPFGGIVVPGYDGFAIAFDPAAPFQTTAYNFTLAATQNDTGFGELTIAEIDGPPGVPEPSTWAMIILGFGILGSAVRQQNARAAIASSRSAAGAHR
jgi:hypothetical protein